MEKVEDRVCVDTDILVDFLRGKEEAAEYMKRLEADRLLATTTVNLFELGYGARKSRKSRHNIQAINQLTERLRILPFAKGAAENAADILAQLQKQGRSIDFRDLFIASTALTHGYCMATRNQEHFTRVPGLRVLE
jgi:tRNA(fMet)-specific endonuclease VapC